MLTIQALRLSYRKKQHLISERLHEFRSVLETSDNRRIFNELAFCILAAGTSAKMGINTVRQIEDIIHTADRKQLSARLRGIYRFYNIRAEYLVHTRNYLNEQHGFRLKELLLSFGDNTERRDFFALNREIRGIGYKEASHFLRNIGFSGYSILDKHVVKSLYELGVLESPKPPSGRNRYLETEAALRKFSLENGFDPDELDLLLWSEKTGEILK